MSPARCSRCGYASLEKRSLRDRRAAFSAKLEEGEAMKMQVTAMAAALLALLCLASSALAKANAGTYEVGCYETHGFLRARDGTFTAFDPPAALNADATGINSEGAIIGVYFDPSSVLHGFLRAANGTFTTIDGPPGSHFIEPD